MISIKFDPTDALLKLNLIRTQQVPFATSLAINKTAQLVKAAEEKEIKDVFDRPTPYIQNSLFIKPSTKQTLTAEVKLKDVSFKGNPATKILKAEIAGGERRLKRYEKLLRSIGVLPDDMVTVPGEAALMDSHGNIQPSQIRQILSYFRANRDVGSTSNSTDKTRAKLAKGTKKRAGISYFVGAPGNGKSPLGIWRKTIAGSFAGPSKPLQPILIFVRATNYEPIYDFEFVAKTTIDKNIENEFTKAMEFALRTAK